ncbi:cell division ATP-binding protein FtsE [Thiobacter aerophilum]|uniref:ATP-binding cassette domain-containing protein n=1 Tax=Thiobacter aerophilum TaxID=3121275 RepID=A0ABV0EEG7_9BURK
MITFSQVTKRYPGGHEALCEASFTIATGEMVAVTGPSGAGKSTLLKLIAGIERPTSGSVLVDGQNIGRLSRKAMPYWRRTLGLVFQDAKLLYDRNCFENVMLPLRISGMPVKEAARRARAALDKVGLKDRERAMPITLSGGEQQRLAIARAIVNRPSILLADEPTGNLDADYAELLLDMLAAFSRAGVTLVIATHEPRLIERLKPRVLALRGGRVLT